MSTVARSIVANRLHPFASLYDPDNEEQPATEQRTNPQFTFHADGRLMSVPLLMDRVQRKAYKQVMIDRNPVCTYCGCQLERATIDHITPCNRGGQNWPANLVLACADCNSSKNDLTLSEWRERLLASTARVAAIVARLEDLITDGQFECFLVGERKSSQHVQAAK